MLTQTRLSFVKPLRAITELCGFPVLTWLYNILVSLAVTSSTAERAMSKVRIIKNRLRTTMLDDWFASLADGAQPMRKIRLSHYQLIA